MLEQIIRDCTYKLVPMMFGLGSIISCEVSNPPTDIIYSDIQTPNNYSENNSKCPNGGIAYSPDKDQDGYGAKYWVCENLPGFVTNNIDCDDTNPNINPSFPEICDGQDNNCDGQIDENLTQKCLNSCGEGSQTCYQGSWTECTSLCSQQTKNYCEGRECGSDSSGGSCGSCGENKICITGTCLPFYDTTCKSNNQNVSNKSCNLKSACVDYCTDPTPLVIWSNPKCCPISKPNLIPTQYTNNKIFCCDGCFDYSFFKDNPSFLEKHCVEPLDPYQK